MKIKEQIELIELDPTKTPSNEDITNFFIPGAKNEKEAFAYFSDYKIVEYSNTRGNKTFLWECRAGMHEGKRGYFIGLGNFNKNQVKEEKPKTEKVAKKGRPKTK